MKVTRSNGHAHMRVLMSQPASSSPYHNGGRILFGPDGMLYAIVGDGHDSSNSQDLTGNLRGKILRMTPAGGVPSDNPIAGQPRLRVRHPQLVRVHVRPADRQSVGDRERPRVQRRDQPDRRRRELRMGTERELQRGLAGEHEQQRSDAAAAPEALVRRDHRHHRRRVLRRLRPGSAGRWPAVLRGREHRRAASRRAERRPRRRVGRRDRRAGQPREARSTPWRPRRTDRSTSATPRRSIGSRLRDRGGVALLDAPTGSTLP